MENKWFGKPPTVDNIILDPKFPCGELDGYHIKESELNLVREIVSFIAFFGRELRNVELDKMIERFNGAVPIDDASVLPPGDGIASVGGHTDNPAEDIETVAKIAVLMKHIIDNVDKVAEDLTEGGEEHFQEVTRERTRKLRARIEHFGRNITDPDMRVGYGDKHDSNSCGCPNCAEPHGDETDIEKFMKRVMDATREMGKRTAAERKHGAKGPVTPEPKAKDDAMPSKADIEAALRKMSEGLKF